jgi:hypothetical protein
MNNKSEEETNKYKRVGVGHTMSFNNVLLIKIIWVHQYSFKIGLGTNSTHAILAKLSSCSLEIELS